MMKYSWETIEAANEEYDILDEAVTTLKRVIDDLNDAPSPRDLKAALEELVFESEQRLEELSVIVEYGDKMEREEMERDYWRSVL